MYRWPAFLVVVFVATASLLGVRLKPGFVLWSPQLGQVPTRQSPPLANASSPPPLRQPPAVPVSQGFRYRTCRELYPAEPSLSQYFYANQFRVEDCPLSTVRVYPTHKAGIGSNLHMLTSSFLCAVAEKKVLVELSQSMAFANPHLCRQQKFTCYFQPLHRCKTPMHHYPFSARVSPETSVDCVDKIARELHLDPNPGNRDWIFKEAVQFLFRPNGWLMENLERRIAQLGIDQPYISLHIRTGERYAWVKDRIAPASPVEDFVSTTVKVARDRNISAVYLSADTQDALHLARSLLTRYGLTVFAIPFSVFPSVAAKRNERAEQFLARYYKNETALGDEGLEMLTNFALLSRGVEIVASHGSNGGRLISELMWCGNTTRPRLTVLQSRLYATPDQIASGTVRLRPPKQLKRKPRS